MSDFNWETYLNNYIDLRNAGINSRELALQHWNNHGKNEGRTDKDINKDINKNINKDINKDINKNINKNINNDFDWETYINNYEDLRNDGINTYESALQHWNNYGKYENRTDKNIESSKKKDNMIFNYDDYSMIVLNYNMDFDADTNIDVGIKNQIKSWLQLCPVKYYHMVGDETQQEDYIFDEENKIIYVKC
jgi:hypothetical protein